MCVLRSILILILILTLPAVVAYIVFGKKAAHADLPKGTPVTKPEKVEKVKARQTNSADTQTSVNTLAR